MGKKIPFTVSLRQMEEVDGYGTLDGCMGMAWCVGGREARFLLDLGVAGKVPRFQLPSCGAAVAGESGGRYSSDQREVEEGGLGEKLTLGRLHGHIVFGSCLCPLYVAAFGTFLSRVVTLGFFFPSISLLLKCILKEVNILEQ